VPEATAKATAATRAEILSILRRHPDKVLSQLEVKLPDAQLWMPLDEGSPRIQIALRPGSKAKIPKSVDVKIGARIFKVALERSGTFEAFRID